ncbi:MAG: Ig-like domain-containing protein, partial [Propionibacteriaceae bacterium]|nr:Ig-like domain-containing protein [Propionibacteriaceae bacterium]
MSRDLGVSSRLNKFVAWVSALALALGGLMVAQVALAPSASAWTTVTVGWDAVGNTFDRNTLYTTYNLWAIPGIANKSSLTTADMHQVASGAPYSSLGTIAVGPRFDDPDELAVYYWRYLRGAAEMSTKDGTSVALTIPTANWSLSNTYGGEMNQKTGQLYLSGDITDNVTCYRNNNNNNGSSLNVAIYDISPTGTVTLAKTLLNNGLVAKNETICRAEQRTVPGVSADQTWLAISDMAIDAEGNYYGVFKADAVGGTPSTVAWLVRVEPPETVNPTTKAGTWLYTPVTRLPDIDANGTTTFYGMAFLDGDLYLGASNGNIIRVNTLTGAKTVLLGAAGNSTVDFGAAQAAPVVRGKLYIDADGDGLISPAEQAAPGVAGATVGVYTVAGVRLGEVTTDQGGEYHALLPSATDDLYIRVQQPQIDVDGDLSTTADGRVNATQVYGYNWTGTDPLVDHRGLGHNKVVAMCRTASNDNVELAESGPCFGAKRSGVDASTTNNVLADAMFFSKVTMDQDLEVAVADFAFTAAGSFGDAGPAGTAVANRTRSTTGDLGPVHVNTNEARVTLGQVGGVYTDGVNDAASDAHASDDGVYLRLHNGSLASVQDQLLSVGRTYALEAHVRVAAGTAAVQNVDVSGWTSANNAANAMIPSSATVLGFGQPNDQGVSTASLTVPTAPSPTGGLSAKTLRVSASTRSGITAPDNTTYQYAPQPGGSAANTQPWVSDGEIEDYRYHVATGQVRVALVSLGGAVSNVPYTVSNAVGTAPSVSGGTLQTVAAGEPWTSTAKHAISNPGAATTLTLTQVPAGHTVVGGSCVDSISGADPWSATTPDHLPPADKPVVVGQSITIPANTYGTPGSDNFWNDLTCTLTIGKMPSVAASEFTLFPADGTAPVGADVTGTIIVRDPSDVVMPGVTVRLTSDDAAVTLKDANGQAITSCVTDNHGECRVRVSSDLVGTYADVVHATVQATAGGPWVEVGPPSDATKRSPKTVVFIAGALPDASQSEFTINEAGPLDAGQAYTLTVTAYDGVGQANSGKGNLVPGATIQFSADPVTGVTFAPQDGRCQTSATGRCSVTFTSTKAGQTHTLRAKVTDRQTGESTDVGGAGDPAKASPQTRAFKAGPPSSAHSSLSVDPESLPVGGTADVKVTLRDQHGNAVSGKAAALNVTATSGATVSATWTEAPAGSGVYLGTVASTTPGTYTVTAAPVGASVDDTVQFLASSSASAAKSTLLVGPAGPIKAGEDYTLTATLYDGVGSANSGRGNLVAGATVTFSVDPGQDFGSKGFSAWTCTSNAMGACQVTFSSSKPGAFNLHAKVEDRDQAGEPLTDVGSTSPQTRVVAVADVSAANSSLTVTPNAIVGEDAAVTLTLKDSFNNPVTGLTNAQLNASVTPPGAVLSPLAENPAGSGVYKGAVTSPTATTYTVSAQPSPLAQALTAQTEFTAASASYEQSRLVVTGPGPVFVGTGQANQYTLTVTAYDAGSNLVTSGQTFNFSTTPTPDPVHGPTLSAASCTSGADGTCSVTVTSEKAGTFDLHAMIGTRDVGGGGQPVQGSPQQRTWAPLTVVDASHSNIVLAKDSMAAGDQVVATITLGDQYGNPITGLTASSMTLSTDQAKTPAPTFAGYTDNGDGTYTVTVQGLVQAGTRTVAAAPGGVQVSDTIQVTASAIDPAKVTWAADPGNPATGQYKRVVLTVKDAFDNPIRGLTLTDFAPTTTSSAHPITLAWDGMGLDPLSPDLLTGQALGEYYWNLRGSLAKVYHPEISIVTATPNPIAKQTAIQVVNSGVGSATLEVVYPAGRTDGIVSYAGDAGDAQGHGVRVDVTVLDSGGAPISSLMASDFSWTPVAWRTPAGRTMDPARDWLVKPGSFTNLGDGKYTWWVASQRSGVYDAQALISGTVASSVADAKFAAAEPKNPGGVTFTICPSSTPCTDDNQDVVQAQPGQAYGFVDVTDDFGNPVELDDLSTANVNEATAAINDALTWTATPTTATPLTATTAWTAQRDGFGNRVGPYTARLAGATGITYTGNVTFTGVTGTDRVRFVAGAATRATLEFDVAEHQACSGATTAGECVQATVKVYDANDNAVTDLTDFTLTSNPVGVFVNVNDAQWAEVSPGAYVATVWATKAAQFYVRATTGSVQTGLTGLKFTPAEVCDPDTNANCPDPTVPNNQRTRLEITVNNAAADGAAKDRVTAHLFDTYGNQIAGAKIRSCAEGCAGVAVATSVIADTDSSGRSVIDYTATSGGAKSVTVQYSLDGGATWKHIRFVPEPGTTPPGAYTSSPATIDFTWRALPTDGTSTLTVTPNPAPAGTGLVARLVVKDAANHAVPGLGDVLTLSSPGMVDIPSAPTEWPVGTYTWNVDGVEAAGPYQAVVEDQGSGSATADYTLTQVASGANSSIAISDNGQGLQANNVDFYTVTVTLKDLTGVPITDGLANAPDGQPKLSLVGPANTDHTIYDLAHTGSGVYTAKVKASAAAAYTVTASYGRGAQAVEIGSVTAGFAKPTPAAANSSFVVSSGDRVVGSGQHTVTATLRNDQNQPVEIVPTQLDGSRALPSATVGAFAQVAGQPGVYRAPITATVAGLKTVEVQWADGTQTVDVAPATAGEDKVAFVAGPAVDPQDTFNVTTGNRLTNGTAFHEAWVMFADQHGNPRPGDSATFTLLDDAESGVATSGARFANADSGSFEVTVQADSTGRAAVKVYSRVPTPVGKTGFPVRAAVGSEASVVKYVPFSPETANPAHSSFTVTPDSGTKVADGADSFAGEIALRDANDLPVPGATASLAVCRVVDASTCAPTTDVAVAAPDGSPANLVASTPDGKILVRFTSVKAGAYQVTAKIGEDPIGAAAPYFKTVQFVAGPADATRSSLVWSAAPVVANGSDTNQVQALVKDAHGNIVADGTAVSFKIPGDVKAGQTEGPAFVPASTAGGYATVALTSVKAGSYVVDASVGGVDVTGNAPALPVFGNGPVSASESLLSITTTGAKTADGTQSHQAQVELKDARGNPAVSAATVVEFCWDVAGQTSPCQDATSAVQEGKALATYSITSLKAGTLTVTAKVKATGNPVSPVTGVTAQFVAGAPDPAASTLTHSQGRVTNNGTATHWSQALITDANGNPTGNVAVTFAVTGSAQFASGQATWTTGPDGKARVEVTDLVAETSTITATIQQGTVGAGSLLFGPGDIDPARSSFTVTPTTSVPVSDGTDANLFTATVVLRDSANAAVPGETVTLEFSGAGPALVGGGTTCTTDVGGSCLARVYSPVAGAWQVKATVDGGTTQIGADKPVTFTADDVAAAHSTLAAQSGAATADGAQTRWVEALIRDRFDNPVSGAAVIFTFPAATTLAAGSSAMFTGADGKARIELKSTTAGAYQVSAQAAKGGAPVAIAPDVQVVFQAGAASAANSSLTIPSAVGGATKVADGAQEHRAEVQVRDANNNAVGAGVAVAFTMTPPGGVAVALAGTTNTQGVAVAHWPSTEAGQHTVTATLNATPVGAGNGSTARFVPGPVDPARSTFQVTGDVVLNNGVNQHAATVIARDAHDNVIGSVPVELTVSEGEATIPGPVLNAAIAGGSATKSLSTDTSGSASSVIVSQEEGTFTVEAKIGSPAVSLGTKTVDFAPGSPSVANSSWVRSPAVGSVQVSQQAPDASYTVTVTVRSGNNLPVGDAPVRLSGLGGALPGDLVIDEAPTAGGYWTTGDKTSDHYGQVILHVRSAVAGDFPITAQILPDQWPTLAIPGSYTLSFTPAPPDPGQSTFTITPAANTVDEHATATFTIKDAHGNGIPGLSPTVDFIPPLQAVVTPNSSGQGVDGVYTWDVTSPSAATFTGTATLVVALPGTDIVKTAQVVFTPGDPADSCVPAGSTTPQPGTRIEIGNTNPVPVDDGFQTAQVTVLDARCNPVPGVAVQWTTDPELTQVADDTTTVTNDAGQAVVKVTSQQAGDFDVTAKQGPGAGTAVTNGSPAVARFAAGACVAAQSSFTVDRTTTPVGDAPGDGVVLTVVMRDQYGNACSDTAPTVQAAPAAGDPDGVTNAVVGSPVLADPATGRYTVTIWDKAAETVLATVLSGSTPVSVGAAPATANPQPIMFEAEQVPANPPCVNPSGQQHDGSHIWVDSAQAVTADGVAYHDVTALVVDRFCNPIPSWAVDWATAPQLDQVAGETSTATDAAGVAKVRVTSTVAGS